jgi:hypothetical protein
VELTTIFYYTDEFCKLFEKNFIAEFGHNLLSDGDGVRNRSICLSASEIMTILIYYHSSGYKTFKSYYTKSHELTRAFNLPSYNRFIEIQNKVAIHLELFIKLIISYAKCDGISFIDSFPLRVSHIKRSSSHKVFRKTAKKGKTSTGWFYGFKIHIVINGYGDILDFIITPGNIADNNHSLILEITKNLFGKIFGDKGYLLKQSLFEKLYINGKHIVTKKRKNMKNKLMDMTDKMGLKKRGIIETVGAVLKEDLNIEHSRYRSPKTLFINVFAALIAYAFREKKPSIYGHEKQEKNECISALLMNA